MRLRKKLWLLCLLLFCLAAGCGCQNRESADEYLGSRITRAKEKGGELSLVLQEGISEIKEAEEFVVDFPEDLKEPYEAFLKEALNQVSFELNRAEKTEEGTYSVRVTYEPIDLEAATEAENLEFVKEIGSTDFGAEAAALLERDLELLDSAKKQQKKSRTVTVTEEGGEFSVKEEELQDLFRDALQGYMSPYKAVADVFDMRDFIQAYLDASLKGETERYREHTGYSEEEAAKWYEDSFSEFRMDEFSEEQNERFQTAAKNIYRNCQYSVGRIRQNSLTEYVFDITTSPNTSFQSAMREFEGGTYYSISEAAEALLSSYDKYAASPTYGEETTVTVTWNAIDVMSPQQEGSEFNRMMETIIPSE